MFSLYGASPGQAITVHCQAPGPSSPVAHCQVDQGRRLVGLPAQHRDLTWATFTLTSTLCDNTPQGGVRFCHRLTLLGTPPLVLPEWRTPLTAAAVSQRLRQFLAGQGPDTLTWITPRPPLEPLQTVLLALLLTVTTWGLTPSPRRPPSLSLEDSDANP
ncbi:MAG: hypothetical protein VKI82_06665 [Leptolyngbya sp.]|nr:hypothetical protein [Leptolyngbya sp.]